MGEDDNVDVLDRSREVRKELTYSFEKAVTDEKTVYRLITDYFKELTGLDRAATSFELRDALDNLFLEDETRALAKNILRRTAIIEYKDDGLSQEELDDLVDDAIGFVDAVVEERSHDDSGSTWSWLPSWALDPLTGDQD